jgi:hypothetical protein
MSAAGKAENAEVLETDSIPAELTALRQWVNWKTTVRGDLPTKVPMRPNGSPAKSNSPDTWTTFDAVVKAHRSRKFDGIGFVFSADDDFCGIDLDACRDPQTGSIAEWAKTIIASFATYSEVSPSKTGVKLFCKGKVPGGKGKKIEIHNVPRAAGKSPAVELYDRGRYFAVTGKIVSGCPGECRAAQAEIDALFQQYFAPRLKTAGARSPEIARGCSSADNRVERCRNYVAKMPAAVSGKGGHNATYSVACEIFRFGLSEGDARAVLQFYNQRCDPEWSDHELQHKLDSAQREVMGSGEFGCRLLDGRNVRPAHGRLHANPDALIAGQKIDPGVYSIPGFIDSVVEYTLSTAPYPNRPLAFCGALALLSVLVGRKVRGPTGLLTNLLVLGLANSGSGKDHPRQVNARILVQAEMGNRISGRIASGQGLEDVVYEEPAHLFQIDEFDSTLIAINKPSDAIGSEIAARLMELYSAAQSTYLMRVKAKKADDNRRSIQHPHVSLFATCIPSNFYSNLTPKLLSNGLVARMLVIESGERGRGQSVKFKEIPQSIINTAEYWRHFNPDDRPQEIEHDDDATAIFEAARRLTEDRYDDCQRDGDNAGCSIWARVWEHAHKLATLYACSQDYRTPFVGEEAAMWATKFAESHATWLLSEIGERAGQESRFEQVATLILKRLKNKGGRILHSEALRASRCDRTEYQKIINTLAERGDVRIEGRGKGSHVCKS